MPVPHRAFACFGLHLPPPALFWMPELTAISKLNCVLKADHAPTKCGGMVMLLVKDIVTIEELANLLRVPRDISESRVFDNTHPLLQNIATCLRVSCRGAKGAAEVGGSLWLKHGIEVTLMPCLSHSAPPTSAAHLAPLRENANTMLYFAVGMLLC